MQGGTRPGASRGGEKIKRKLCRVQARGEEKQD